MKRGGDARSYRSMIERARAVVPELTLRTTFIVGFPGEGEEEFVELMDFVREVKFDHLGALSYSWQEENPGADLGDPVTDEEKVQRHQLLMEAQQKIALDHNRALIGRNLPALVAGPLPEMELLLEARLQRQAPEIDGRLLINDGTALPGSLVEVEITDAHEYDTVGRLVRVLAPGEASAVHLPVMG
jgi:ribosomal protein S12 methylthiotransferase